MSMAILALEKTSRFGGMEAGELKRNPTARQKQDAVKHSEKFCLIDPRRYEAIYEVAKQAAMQELTAPTEEPKPEIKE